MTCLLMNRKRPRNGVSNLSKFGRYWYVNPYGIEHAVRIRKEADKIFVIFDDQKELPREFLYGKFYYRN